MNNLLNELHIAQDEQFPYGIIYHPTSNKVVRVKREIALSLKNLIGQPNAPDNLVLTKLQNCFSGTSQCLKEETTFVQNKKISRLMILIQNGCNLNCKYCYADGGTYNRKTVVLTPDQGANIIQTFCKLGIEEIDRIIFFGGEPSVYPETIRAICESCQTMYESSNLIHIPNFYMITNSTAISPACRDIIKKFNITLTISLDGPKHINDSLRVDRAGNGTFDNVCKNITLLKESGIEPAMIEATYTSVHEQNNLSRDDTRNILRKLTGIDAIHVCDCKGSALQPLCRSVAELTAEQERLLKLLFSTFNFHEIPLKTLEDILTIGKKLNSREVPSYMCAVGYESLCITPQGDIYPCQFFINKSNFHMGNIFDEKYTLGDASNVYPHLSKLSKIGYEKCQQCYAKNICDMCTYRAYEAQTNIATARRFNDDCLVTRTRFEKILLYLYNMNQPERETFYNELIAYLDNRCFTTPE